MNQHAPDRDPISRPSRASIRLHPRLQASARTVPAEADMQRFFQVTSPSVHQMILWLEKAGLITRQPGIARSVTLAVNPADLPELVRALINQSKSLCKLLRGIPEAIRLGCHPRHDEFM